MRYKFLAAIAAGAVIATAAIPAIASAGTRQPVIGCVYGGTNDFRARYQPKHCTTVTNQNHYIVNYDWFLTGIHWTQWGHGHAATGTAHVNKPAKLMASATLRAYRIRVSCTGQRAYTRLSATWAGRHAGSVAFDTTPHCGPFE